MSIFFLSFLFQRIACNHKDDEYYIGIEDPNNFKSYLYYQQSSEAGNKYASYTLGILYKKGFGIEQDFNKSFYYFQKSYEQGNIYALNQLAMFYKYGLGVDQNITKTIDYYEKILNACKSLKYNELFAVKCIANHTVKAYEYDALSKLHHSHIFFLYELFEEQDSQYLAMDYYPNDT
ncbi:hypothetical protein M9Y10_025048 [Tritrichomonas musculus]|uniref:Uncharacterized protein n=1 Tax=Tritrichomonas musculus TaxID=1915356 RepID=A0ABR2HAC8_9EUKA